MWSQNNNNIFGSSLRLVQTNLHQESMKHSSSICDLVHYKWLVWAFIALTLVKVGESATECLKRKYFVNLLGQPLNATTKCPMYFQWTVNDQCCYDRFDRFENHPICCYSETYKLVVAVGFICLVLLGSSCCIFICWVYNLPHHILYILTCRRFNLNSFLLSNKNGPYVDPSFYSGQPFWARGGETQPYPLRPMPPNIFYPASNMKLRWDMAHGQMPLFVLASRQFTRNPYSARPNERHIIPQQLPPFLSNMTLSNPGSRRSSMTTFHQHERESHSHNKHAMPTFGYTVNIDEMEAAAELLEALKNMEEKGDKFPPEVWNVAENLGIKMVPDYPGGNGKTVDVPSSIIVRPRTDAGRNPTNNNDLPPLAGTITPTSNYSYSSSLGMPMPVYTTPGVHSSGNNSSTGNRHRNTFSRSDSLPGAIGGTVVMESIPEDDIPEGDGNEKEINANNRTIRELMGRRLSTASAIESTTATSTTVVPFVPSLPGHIPEKQDSVDRSDCSSAAIGRRNSADVHS